MKNSRTKNPKSSIKWGDVFQLGDHFLLCGDATKHKLIKKFLSNHTVNMILTDPPYGVAYVERKEHLVQSAQKHKKIANDHEQTETEYTAFTKDWLEPVRDVLTPHNTFYIFNSDRMLFALREGIQQSGYFFGQLLIWIKNSAVMGRRDYLPQHELIAYGWHGSHVFRKSKDKSILCYPKPQKNTLHPTMKPIGLLRRLILNSTKIGDVVYDPFGGSGSTLIACEQTKRKCLMVELDEEYCQVILDRFQKLIGVQPKKLSSLSSAQS